MIDLLDFLAARLQEDEDTARAATAGPWRWEHGEGDLCNDPECPYGTLIGVWEDGETPFHIWDVHGFDAKEGSRADADHIARHDPARVLREVAAKRAIIEEHTCPCSDDCDDCGACSGSHMADPTPAPCNTLKLLALPYADHPAYNPKWRP